MGESPVEVARHGLQVVRQRRFLLAGFTVTGAILVAATGVNDVMASSPRLRKLNRRLSETQAAYQGMVADLTSMEADIAELHAFAETFEDSPGMYVAASKIHEIAWDVDTKRKAALYR